MRSLFLACDGATRAWLMLPELAKVQPIQAEIARPRQYIHLRRCTHHTF